MWIVLSNTIHIRYQSISLILYLRTDIKALLYICIAC